MNQIPNMGLIWLLVTLATIFSFINLFLFIKLLRKVDDYMLILAEAIEVFNEQLARSIKEVELIKRNVRIVNNEVKEQKHRKDK